MFEPINILRQQLSNENKIEVIHGSHIWQAAFDWHPPASVISVDQAECHLGTALPSDYKYFLTEISDGGTLFYDKQYGQWGYRLYGASDILKKQLLWQKSIPSIEWGSRFLAFAELYGEASALVFDLTQPSQDLISCAVIETNVFTPVDEWAVVSLYSILPTK